MCWRGDGSVGRSVVLQNQPRFNSRSLPVFVHFFFVFFLLSNIPVDAHFSQFVFLLFLNFQSIQQTSNFGFSTSWPLQARLLVKIKVCPEIQETDFVKYQIMSFSSVSPCRYNGWIAETTTSSEYANNELSSCQVTSFKNFRIRRA